MNITVARYQVDGSIVAVIDGETVSVSNDPANRERRAVEAWEKAGNSITPYAPPAPIGAQVKLEAERRILIILPEWKQRNLTARAAELAMKKGTDSSLTAAEQAEWDTGQALWVKIKAIRAKSNALEAMNPIPADYDDDKHWL